MPIVVQIDAYDPAIAGTITLRMASDDDAAVCHLDGQLWWPVLDKLPTLAMDFFGGEFGQVTTAAASLSLAVEPWPDFARYAFVDARIRIWHGAYGAAWAGYTLRFDGRVTSQPVIEDGRAQIGFAVDDQWLDTPLLATYAGTGGIEGAAAMKGTAKPLAIGAPMGVAGVMLDPIKSIIQLSAYGAIESVDVPLEKLARQFGSALANYASYAALDAATVPAGQWATANAVGLVRMGAPPYGKLCFLMKGDKGGVDGWVRRPGAIIKRLAALAGGAAKVSEASVDALDTMRPYDLSVYYDSQTNARAAIQEIAASVNAVAGVSLTGQMIVVPIQINASTLTLRADGSSLPIVGAVRALGISAPWWRLSIGAQPFFDVHGQGDYATETTPEAGATFGAPAGSPVAGVDAEVVVTNTSTALTQSGTALTQSTEALAQSDAALEGAEGALASAQVAADEAAAALASSVAAANEAVAAATAKIAAEAAANQAAADEALAEAHKTAAGASSSSASGSATTATGKATIATDAASAAATSQSVAAGHASTATTQAGVSTTQAVAATAAASTATTQAGLSASFSQQSGNSLATIYPRTIAQPAFVSGNDRREYPFSATTVALDSDFNAAKTKIQNQVGVSAYPYGIWLRGTSPLVAGKTLRATIKAQTIAAVGGVNHGAWFVVLFNDSGYLTELLQGSSFQIAPAAMTAYTYDFNLSALLSSYPAAKYIRVGILCNRASGLDGLQTGSRTDFEAFYLDDATESAAAASSANIATTQASLATSAGSTATTQANLSATYAGQAAGSASTAGTQATNAASSAATATDQAAAAQSSAVLSASITRQSLNPNPSFADLAGDYYPTASNWGHWFNTPTQAYRTPGLTGGWSWVINAAANLTTGINTTGNYQMRPGWYVLECDFELFDGSLNGSGIYLSGKNAGGAEIETPRWPLNTLRGSDGNTVNEGGLSGCRPMRTSTLFQMTNANLTQFGIVFMASWSGFSQGQPYKQVAARYVGVRPATPSEIRDQTVLSPLQATVSTQQTAIATLNTRTATYLNRVTAGAGQAEVELIATDSNGNATSNVNIRAAKITLGGQTTPVLTIADGDATFGSDVYVNNAKIVVDTGTYMKVIGKGFGTTNQFVEWYGPKMSFNLCSEANAIQYLKTNGSAYFGGSLSAGVLKNSGQNSGLGTNEFFELGPFGTNGGPKLVSVGWTYEVVQSNFYAGTSAGLSAFNAEASAAGAVDTGDGYFQGSINQTVGNTSVTLERSISGGAYAFAANSGTTIMTRSFAGQRPVVGDSPRKSTTNFSSSASFTYTDNVAGTGDRKFKAILARGYSVGSGSVSQRLGMVSTE